jgi:glycine dehydrogenase subunit 1
MAYLPIPAEHRSAMLAAVGVESVEELFDDIPACSRLDRPLALPAALSEMELSAHLDGLAGRNAGASKLVSFMGAGCYDTWVPPLVDSVVSRPEFFTAYTPYQPEVSQGTLQAIYEFQSFVCRLTGMDVANASMYDGATAMVEAALLASHFTRRKRVVVAGTVHPEWRGTLRTYARAGLVEPVVAPVRDGLTDVSALSALVADAACVIVADPNFVGGLEDLAAIGEIAHGAGALFVVATDLSLAGVLAPPSQAGADVVVGEGQPLGNSMSFGGPGFGFFAARKQYLRRMPGRIAGRTVDVDGRPGFVLTMQTREQHIRREKATSNICSNHALCALAATVHLSLLGPQGLAEMGKRAVASAHYLRHRLLATGRFTAPWDAPFAREFALRFDGDVAAMRETMLERGFLAGVDLARFAGLADALGVKASDLVLFATTEKRTRDEIDRFVTEMESL